MHEAQKSTKIGGKSQHYFHFIGRMENDFPYYNWQIRPKLELVAPDIVLHVFFSEQEKNKILICTQDTKTLQHSL